MIHQNNKNTCTFLHHIFLQIYTVFKQYSSSTSSPQFFHLKSRGLLQVKGKDVVPFLQGLVTNDVELLGSQMQAQYTMLLNVQVKYRQYLCEQICCPSQIQNKT